jgi:hypothetical protein
VSPREHHVVNSVHRLVPRAWPAGEEPRQEPALPLAEAAGKAAAPLLDLDAKLCGSAVTLLHRVLPERRTELVELLEQMGQDIDGTREIPFNELETVHFMRWVVVEGAAPGEPTQLMFESNYDGTLEQHLGELLRRGSEGMHRIYRCCAGYPQHGAPQLAESERALVTTFLKAGRLPYQAFYVGRRGKSARRIKLEAGLRDAIQQFLDAQGPNPLRALGGTAQAAYRAIVAHLEQEHGEALSRWRQLHGAAPPGPRRRLLQLLLRLPLYLPLVPLLPVLYPWLRHLEKTEQPLQLDVLPEQTYQLSQREDFQVQNQLTHLVAVKPGLFRQLLLRLVLASIDLLGRFHFNQGDLGGLATIHFARWVLIDGGRRLIFFSNYDGSWERYLGDFVDQAHVGLTAVWSNTRGFPRTKNLVQDGATDEEHFKNWTRQHQIPTQLWYSAYPQLTVPNVGRNAEICAGLAVAPAGADQLNRWLELL